MGLLCAQRVALAIWAVCLVGSAPLHAMAPSPDTRLVDPELRAYRATLLQYFRAHNVLPIALSVGEDIGAAFEVPTWTLLSRGDECFDTSRLQVRSTPQLLPDMTLRRTSDIRFQAGLASLANARALADRDVIATVKFHDVTVLSVSSQALRQASRNACPSLIPILEGNPLPVNQPAPLVAVIGTLVIARREFRIESTNSASGNAAISDLRSVVTRVVGERAGANLNIGEISAEVGAGMRGGSVFSIVESQPRVVAFAPAFLPRQVFEESRGPNGAVITSLRPRIEWRDYAAENPASVAALLSLVAELEGPLLGP